MLALKKVKFRNNISGYSSVIAVILFLGCVQLLALGIIGEYLGIVYLEAKKRPIYLINECKKTNELNEYCAIEISS
jgi:glycosyltransferase involved in cell wall biosynthesis